MTIGTAKYMNRADSTKRIRDEGVTIGDTALDTYASKGGGPKYSIINGRALYREADLLAWIEAQAKQRPEDASQRGRVKGNQKILKPTRVPKREVRRERATA